MKLAQLIASTEAGTNHARNAAEHDQPVKPTGNYARHICGQTHTLYHAHIETANFGYVWCYACRWFTSQA